jgi:hypothetical protein
MVVVMVARLDEKRVETMGDLLADAKVEMLAEKLAGETGAKLVVKKVALTVAKWVERRGRE